MNTAHQPKADFDQRYQTHLKHLKLKGLQPKTRPWGQVFQ